MKIIYKNFFILIFILFLFSTYSFADNSVTVNFKNKDYTFADYSSYVENKYFIIFGNSNSNGIYFLLLVSDSSDNFSSVSLNKISYTSTDCYFNRYYNNNYSGWLSNGKNISSSFTAYSSTDEILLSNFDILNSDGSVFFKANVSSNINLIYPFITNSEEVLSTGNFDYLCINSGDFIEDNWQDFYLLTYNYISDDTDITNIYPKKEILLSGGINNKYYTNTYESSYIYMIPSSDLGLNFSNGLKYGFKLAIKEQIEFEGNFIDTYNYFYETSFIVGELSAEDKEQNSQDRINSQLEEQNKQLEEQNKTSKNIFEKIGDILTIIVELPGKLVNLLLDGLKSLFIPGDNFFECYFNDLNDWFSDRLGFLYYPLELLFDLLDRFTNINFEEPIINIPEIKEPFTDVTIIQKQNFNFNTLLENEILKTIHDIYLILVDAIIYIGLVILLYYKYEEVIAK